MTRQLDNENEERQARKDSAALSVLNGGLVAAVSRAGGELTGFTAKIDPVETLLVIKAEFPGGPMVAFCGSADLKSALVKAAREAARDNLRWKQDRYAGPRGVDTGGQKD